MVWSQIYNPLGNAWLSTLVAAIPIVVLLGALGIFRIKAHVAAIYGLIASLLVATIVYGMPVSMAGETAVFGAAFGLMPIGWIILNVIFLYQLTLEKGYFKVMQDSIAGVSQDRRLQLLLIAFCFGAFFEGASGFGTPVAVTGAIWVGVFTARRLRIVVDRQYRARRLWCAGHADHRARGGDRPRPLRPQRDGRPATSVLFTYRAVLVDLGLRWLARHARDLAGHPRGRRQLCHSAISDLKFSRALARRRSCVGRFDGLPDCLPQVLASAKDLDDDGSAWPAGRPGIQ